MAVFVMRLRSGKFREHEMIIRNAQEMKENERKRSQNEKKKYVMNME